MPSATSFAEAVAFRRPDNLSTVSQPSTSPGLRSPEVRVGFRLLAGTLVRYRWISIISIVGALLWMALVVTIPYLIKVIIDRSIEPGVVEVLLPLVIGLVVAGALQAGSIAVRRYYGFKLSYRAEADIRNRMFEHIQRLAFTFHDHTSAGQLMARASSDLGQVRLILAMLPITIANVAMFVLVVVVLVVIDPVLGLVASLTVPGLLLAAARYASRVVGISFSVQQRLADLSQVVEEAMAGIEVVKSYGQEGQELAKLGEAAHGIYDDTIALARHRAVYSPLFELIPSAGTVAVLWLGGIRVVEGAISIGDFVAFTQYLAVLVFPLLITGWFFANLPRAAASAARVDELLATAPQIETPKRPVALPAGSGEIRFEDVRFSYEGGPAILEGVDLVVPGGTSVALVGATGSGKTTLAHLIPRFYDVSEGRVLLDGVDVRALALDDLRSEVSVVFQETFLFSVSVADNIRVGDPMAGDTMVQSAARLAQAHGFICELPDGYSTVVGERGATLSGGQRQRVALARGVIRDPRVLILDDATSSVDAVVEAEIQEALRHVMHGRTTIIIAHRTSTLAIVDLVVFIEHGKVTATGTHAELLATVPRYAEVLAGDDGRTEEPS
jgi:ATP-binding cassette, subfamily B, bacterial